MGACYTTIGKLRIAAMAMRIDLGANMVCRLANLNSRTIGRDHGHVTTTVRCDNCGFPVTSVAVGLTPTGLHGRNDDFSLPLTVNVLNTGDGVPRSRLGRCVVINRLDLSNALRPVGKTLPVTVGTESRRCGNLVMPRRGTQRTTIIGGLRICKVGGLFSIVRFLNSGSSPAPAVMSAHGRFCRGRIRYSCSCTSMGNRRGIGHTLRMTTTNNRGLVVMNPPNSKGSVVTGHLPSVLPPLALSRDLRAARVRSVTNGLTGGMSLVTRHPFETPRRAVSRMTLMNKKASPRPNRVSLTRGNILFYSRLPRFGGAALRILHRPLRSHRVGVDETGCTVSCPYSFVFMTDVGPYPYNCCNSPARRYIYAPKRVRHCVGGVSNPLLSHVSVRYRVDPMPFGSVSGTTPKRPDTEVEREMVETQRVRTREFGSFGKVRYGTRVARHVVRRFTRPARRKVGLLEVTVRGLSLSTHTCGHVLGITHAVTSLTKDRRVRPRRLTRTVKCQALSEKS